MSKPLKQIKEPLQIKTKQYEEEQGYYLSWSSTKNWVDCAHYFKLTKIDNVPGFEGNLHTAFGNGVHWTVETQLNPLRIEELDLSDTFTEKFELAISELPNSEKEKIELEREKLVANPDKSSLEKEMREQGRELVHFLVPALDKFFGLWELVGIEERFYEKCDFYELSNFFFKGYIDIIIKTSDGKYHIIDWKTCSWGWKAEKKTEPMTTYQLTLYKYFFCKKYEINPKDVETYFALCKRTNKTDKRVEIFKVTSGTKKTSNALNLLRKAVYNVDHSFHMKNRLSCHRCQFRHTKHCT